MKTAFLGTPRLAQIVLENLIQASYKPQLVITSPDKKMGRGQKRQSSAVKQTAQAYNIETRTNPVELKDFAPELAILVAYGQIIPKELLEIPKFGFLNVHPSLLPKYRGSSPIQTAILEGEKETGVSIMKLDEELDHGAVLAQKSIPIELTDTHLSLTEKLGTIGSNLLHEVLPDYLSGNIKPKPQDHAKATYTKKISKKDGYIDLFNPPDPQTLDRMIRAFYPWPGVWCKLTVNGSQLTVKLLPNNLIQPEGKRPMTIKEFLNGYPQAKPLLQKLQLI